MSREEDIRGRVEALMSTEGYGYLNAYKAVKANAPADLAYLLAENARLRAQLDTVREVADNAPMVPVHAGGGNLVNSKRMVSTDDLRAALNQGGETNGE